MGHDRQTRVRQLRHRTDRLRDPPDIVDMDQQGVLLCDDLTERLDNSRPSRKPKQFAPRRHRRKPSINASAGELLNQRPPLATDNDGPVPKMRQTLQHAQQFALSAADLGDAVNEKNGRGHTVEASYQAMVSRRPSSKGVVARKPNSFSARETSRQRRGWPSGRDASQTSRPL